MPFPLDFELPPHLIAQQPCPRRDQSRLLVLRRHDQSLAHHHVADLPTLLSSGDLLVVNDTRVLPARLVGRRQTGGKWEGLFVKTLADGSWEMLCKGRLRPGEIISVEPAAAGLESGTNPSLRGELRLIARLGPGRWQVHSVGGREAGQFLEKHGHVPLPPYIRKGQDQPEDHERYQTVFARQLGAVAAPTAGLHFTPELLQQLQNTGIGRSEVTLHVGLGTFQPIQEDDFTRHVMHHEWAELPEKTVRAIADCRARQGRVVAVGTTSVRVLETVAAAGELRAWSGQTNLFIYPPYRFMATDALLTNFHLPRSTLLLLVGAFAGVPLLEKAYRTAIAEEYRFFSYGDAMLIL
jgi:S-adenosylmethionine:tRNA ribosyltransferase-isomerase